MCVQDEWIFSVFQSLFRDTKVSVVVDASHPFAAQVSSTVKEACENTGVKYIRFVRKDCGYDYEKIFYVDDALKRQQWQHPWKATSF